MSKFRRVLQLYNFWGNLVQYIVLDLYRMSVFSYSARIFCFSNFESTFFGFSILNFFPFLAETQKDVQVPSQSGPNNQQNATGSLNANNQQAGNLNNLGSRPPQGKKSRSSTGNSSGNGGFFRRLFCCIRPNAAGENRAPRAPKKRGKGKNKNKGAILQTYAIADNSCDSSLPFPHNTYAPKVTVVHFLEKL